jgi:uncharacterized ferredoxin-like protein
VKHTENGLVILLVNVDDMLIAAASLKEVEAVKALIMIKFEARDIREACLFLGCLLSETVAKSCCGCIRVDM